MTPSTNLIISKSSRIIGRDNRVMSTSYGRECDFVFSRGKGCWVFDVEGKRL